MIEINGKQVIATFGTGDIGVSDLVGFNGERFLGFKNQTAREIGEEGDLKKGDYVRNDEFQILFDFKKAESIDVIIEQLQGVRKQFSE